MDGFTPLKPLFDDMVWGTAALKHATTWQHIYGEGLATAITNMVGLKYWVMARRRGAIPPLSTKGDLGALGFGNNIRPTSASGDIYEHEGVLLSPGSVLCACSYI
jgi:hypothetical protein